MPSTQRDVIDGVSTSLSLKAPVRCAATAAATTLSGTQSVTTNAGAVALVAEDRVLLTAQAAGADNVIWVVKSTTWERAVDFDGARDAVKGTRVPVADGSETWIVTTANPLTLGTTSLTWALDSTLDTTIAGKIGGSTGATDNQLLRSDGTGTKTLQNTGITVTDANAMYGYLAAYNYQTGTTYTLLATDTGKIVSFDNASAITVTVPNSLAIGFCCTVEQIGTGQITFSPEAGATVSNRQTHTKTAGRYAQVTLSCRSGTGANAGYILAGDTAS